eukprot:GGOE01036841.1.p1 GENE.GGOE01036841.1~~GGOE01036841.1.p1  ORF type:complete len:426 (+),score=54.56 GGOE01036841.1:75-1280(+)
MSEAPHTPNSAKKVPRGALKAGKSEKLQPLKKGAARVPAREAETPSPMKPSSAPAGPSRVPDAGSNKAKATEDLGVARKMTVDGCVRVRNEILCRSLTDETVFSVRFSPDGKLFAAAVGNGTVQCFNAQGTPHRVLRTQNPTKEELPCTCVRWVPAIAKSILVIACAHGSVQLMDVATGHVEATILEPNNEVLTVDCSPDGARFASAGSDRTVRVYDVSTSQLLHELQSGYDFAGRVTAGHSNRIYSALYATPTMLLTGGWDKTVQVYDTRAGKSIRTLFGPKVSGDGLDVRNTTVIAASCDASSQLQAFDFTSGKEYPTDSLCQHIGQSYLYSCKFNPNGTHIWACGTQPNVVFGLDRQKGTVLGRLLGAPRSLFCIDIAPDGKTVLAGGSHLGIYTLLV